MKLIGGIDTSVFLENFLAQPEAVNGLEKIRADLFGDSLMAYAVKVSDEVERGQRLLRAILVAGFMIGYLVATREPTHSPPPPLPTLDELVKSLKLANKNYLERKV